eukprot:TRINITY_DN24531_c0_g1_i1.p1 TRINITY_DN24531_c0_g1~~TRINITY_DN24531_c0_g1_i1.p1  ORF type:complete len:140 (-),score=13.48 TRINITY_DN24531_c0_g1_i1:41-460(-)
MKTIATMLYSLKNLSRLDLNFYRDSITDDGVNTICSQVAKLMHLTSLTLRFGGTQATDVGVFYIIHALESLGQLSVLFLDLSWCNGVTDASAYKIAELLEANETLIDVKLDTRMSRVMQAGQTCLKKANTKAFVRFEIK